MRKTNFLLILLLGLFTISCFGPKDDTLSSYDILYHSERWGTWIVVSDIYGNQYEICPDSAMVDQVDGTYSSEDGDLIFSSSSSYTHSRNIYKYFAQKGELILLTDTLDHDSYPSLSPDNRYLAYSSWNYNIPGSSIHMMDLNTKVVKQVIHGDNNHYYPLFSPDGSKILFSENINGENHISIIDTGSTNYMVLGSLYGNVSHFQFSSSGDKIFYENNLGIMSCDLNGSNNDMLVNGEQGYLYVCFTHTIDSLIYFTLVDYENEIYTLNKVNTALKKTSIIKQFPYKVVLGDVSSDGLLFLYQTWGDEGGRICVYNKTDNTETYISDTESWDWAPRFNRYLY